MAVEDMNEMTKGMILFLLTIILSSVAVFYAYDEISLTKTATLWFYGVLFIVILGIGQTRKAPEVRGFFLAFALGFVWWAISTNSDAFRDALFLYSILVVLAFAFLFRKEIEQRV